MFVLAFNSMSLAASFVVVQLSAISWLFTLPFVAAWGLSLAFCAIEEHERDRASA